MGIRLKNLEIDRIDLVDAPANPGSRVVLVKRHVAATPKLTLGQRLAKAFDDVFKVGNDVRDWADDGGNGDDPAKPAVKASAALTAMQVHHADLGRAIASMGDSSKLPADHPIHALKTAHAKLGKDIETMGAEEASAAPAPDATPGGGDGGDGVVKSQREKAPMAGSIRKQAADEVDARAEHLRLHDPTYRTKWGKPMTKQQAYAKATLPVNQGGDPEANAAMQRHQDAKAQGVADTLTDAEPPGAPLAKADAAWAEIERLAAGVVQKSGDRLSRAQAIDFVQQLRPDLVRKHWIEAYGRDPLAATAARR